MASGSLAELLKIKNLLRTDLLLLVLHPKLLGNIHDNPNLYQTLQTDFIQR